MGLLLIVLPWSTFWELNYFGYAWPPLVPLLRNDFIRGAVSGLGFVNVVVGFFELVPVLAMRARRESDASGDDPAETES